MERVKQAVVRLSADSVRDRALPAPLLERSLKPVLSAASVLYSCLLRLRLVLYRWRVLRQRRLPVAVLSVGNLTWGGTGKTPMAEFVARACIAAGIRPLVLSRGYGGGDEARLLASHLRLRADVGCGADRASVATRFLQERGVVGLEELRRLACGFQVSPQGVMESSEPGEAKDGIGVIILDDGMQQWGLVKDLEVVMVNALTGWGNGKLLPRGPLREPVEELRRADVVVIHHADLVPPSRLVRLRSMVKVNALCLHSRMAPLHLSRIPDAHVGDSLTVPLSKVQGKVVLCVSGVGCPESLSLVVKQLGALHVADMMFSDHHYFTSKDISLLEAKISELQQEFQEKVLLVITEKDYMRDPGAFFQLRRADVLVLHSTLILLDEASTLQHLDRLLARAICGPLQKSGFPVSIRDDTGTSDPHLVPTHDEQMPLPTA